MEKGKKGLFFSPFYILMHALSLFLPLHLAVVSTILCILFTSLLIIGLPAGGPAYHLLKMPWLVFVGLLSYSLYLWHWPVLVLSRWTVGIHPETIPWQLSLIAALSWLSYRWVETPLRYVRWPMTRFGSILISLQIGRAHV